MSTKLLLAENATKSNQIRYTVTDEVKEYTDKLYDVYKVIKSAEIKEEIPFKMVKVGEYISYGIYKMTRKDGYIDVYFNNDDIIFGYTFTIPFDTFEEIGYNKQATKDEIYNYLQKLVALALYSKRIKSNIKKVKQLYQRNAELMDNMNFEIVE